MCYNCSLCRITKGSDFLKKLTKEIIKESLLTLAFSMIFIGIATQIFGSNNSLVWVCICVGITMYRKMNISLHPKEAPFILIVLFILMGISNRLALIHPILGIFINFVTIMIIMYIPSTKAEQKPYMPFILGYIFGQSAPAIGNDFYSRILSWLIGGMIVAGVYWISHRKSKETGTTLKEMIQTVDVTSDRFVLAIKMAAGITIAMLLGSIFGLKKTMWIACSIMSITQINLEQTKQRFKYRILSTVLGAILFVILFQFLIPEHYTLIATLILNIMYAFVEEYSVQIVFITINALSSSMILFDPYTAVETRVLLVITGCFIGYIINHIPLKTLLTKWKEGKKSYLLQEKT